MNRLAVLFLSTLLLAGAGACSKDVPAPADTPAAEKAAAPPLPSDVEGLQNLNGAKAAAGDSAAPSPAAPGETPPAASPEVQISSEVAATGEFVSPTTSELAVKLPGRVGKVMVDEGDRVRRGQPVLVLESDYLSLDLKRAEADVTRSRAAVTEAERDFKRKEDLIGKGSVSQAAFDRSRSGFDSAQAGLQAAEASRDLARQRLADAVLRAPIDGVVAERRTDVGERLGDNSVAFVIVQTSPLKLRFRVPERYLARLREGQGVSATVDPYPGERFEGRVTQVVRVVDPATRTIAVETEFANRDGRLYPGLFARVDLDLSGAGAREGAAR